MSEAMPPYGLTSKEIAELKAHHLACGQLVRGAQQAIFQLRKQGGVDVESETVSFRAIEIMEHIVASWCDTLSILRSALDRGLLRENPYHFTAGPYPDRPAGKSAQTMTRLAK